MLLSGEAHETSQFHVTGCVGFERLCKSNRDGQWRQVHINWRMLFTIYSRGGWLISLPRRRYAEATGTLCPVHTIRAMQFYLHAYAGGLGVCGQGAGKPTRCTIERILARIRACNKVTHGQVGNHKSRDMGQSVRARYRSGACNSRNSA